MESTMMPFFYPDSHHGDTGVSSPSEPAQVAVPEITTEGQSDRSGPRTRADHIQKPGPVQKGIRKKKRIITEARKEQNRVAQAIFRRLYQNTPGRLYNESPLMLDAQGSGSGSVTHNCKMKEGEEGRRVHL